MSEFLPNSYQTPNAYVDQYMHLLTPEEWMVLSYAARRIFGFNKRQDRISLSQFTSGTKDRDGYQLDYGTGLAKPTVLAALAGLVAHKLVIKVEQPNDGKTDQQGTCYELQMDSRKVNRAGLEGRAAEKAASYQNRTKQARQAKQEKQVVNGTDHLESETGGQSDLPQVVNGTDREWSMGLTHNNQGNPGKTTTTPYPLSDDGPGPYGNDWDPAESGYASGGDDADLDDDSLGGGGGDEEDEWDMPATPLKPIERVVIGGLVGGGGEWDAEQYERLAAFGVAAPQSAPPPTAAPDISWAECSAALAAPEINVQYPGSLQSIGLPYRAILKKARQMARGGAGGGAIVKWFKNPENVEQLRAELSRPTAQVVTATPDVDPISPAQLLKQRPAWCSARAWEGTSEALRAKLRDGTLEDGWLWMSSRRTQDAVNSKYRQDIIAVLQQSGIEPNPPAVPAHQAAATGIWGRAAA